MVGPKLNSTSLLKPTTDLFLPVVSVAMLFPFYLALHKLFFNIKFCINVADSSVFEGRFALILSFNISNNDIVAVMLHQLRAVIVILIKFQELLKGEGKRSTSAELVK